MTNVQGLAKVDCMMGAGGVCFFLYLTGLCVLELHDGSVMLM